MKKVLLGGAFGGFIFFMIQSLFWMGGFHNDFSTGTAQSKPILDVLSSTLHEDGLYLLPCADPNSPDRKKEEESLMTANVGRPWAMIFYHKSMNDLTASYILIGLLYALLSGMLTAFVLNFGNFNKAKHIFIVSMCFAIFTLIQGSLDEMNWFDFPWSYIKAEVLDMLVGWTLVSLWFSWYFNKN